MRMRSHDHVLYTDTMLDDPVRAKTAYAMLRFAPERVRAVYDVRFAGKPLESVCPEFAHLDLPIVGVPALVSDRDKFVIGFAPLGGKLTDSQRLVIESVIDRGAHVINGLHDQLGPPERVTNLRRFDPADRWYMSGAAMTGQRILTVGTSFSIGKMTTAVVLSDALAKSGLRAGWVATGQTGVLLSGRGRVLDAVPNDFMQGNVERLVLDTLADFDVIVIEGQGTIFHPGFSGLPVILMHVAAPQHLILCHRLNQETFGGPFTQRLPTVERAVEAHNLLAASLSVDSQVSAVSLDSSRVTFDEYLRERDFIQVRTGLPCCDPVRDTPDPLVAAVAP